MLKTGTIEVAHEIKQRHLFVSDTFLSQITRISLNWNILSPLSEGCAEQILTVFLISQSESIVKVEHWCNCKINNKASQYQGG